MRLQNLRYASAVAAGSFLTMTVCAYVMSLVDDWERAHIAAHTPYNTWLPGAFFIPAGIAFICGLWVFLKALITMGGSLLPESGRLRDWYDKDENLTGSLRSTVDFWKFAALNIHKWLPKFGKWTGYTLLVIVGMAACTAGVFGVGSMVSGWPVGQS